MQTDTIPQYGYIIDKDGLVQKPTYLRAKLLPSMRKMVAGPDARERDRLARFNLSAMDIPALIAWADEHAPDLGFHLSSAPGEGYAEHRRWPQFGQAWFGTPRTEALLKLVFRHQGRIWKAKDIARDLPCDLMGAEHTLGLYAMIGLLARVGSGNEYQLDPSSAAYQPLLRFLSVIDPRIDNTPQAYEVKPYMQSETLKRVHGWKLHRWTEWLFGKSLRAEYLMALCDGQWHAVSELNSLLGFDGYHRRSEKAHLKTLERLRSQEMVESMDGGSVWRLLPTLPGLRAFPVLVKDVREIAASAVPPKD